MDYAGRANRPIAKQGLAVNVFFGDQSPASRIAGIVAVITHHKVVVWPDVDGGLALRRKIKPRIQILFVELRSVYPHDAFAQLNRVSRQSDDTLDVTLGRVIREPEDHNIAALNLRRP